MLLGNLKLGSKLAIAFGGITIILIIVGLWSTNGISGIVDNAKTTIKGNELRADLETKYVQHLKWSAALTNYINNVTVKELKLETDHTKCDFGKWYYGEGKKEAIKMAPSLKEILVKFEQPHKDLHASAIKIENTLNKEELNLEDSLNMKSFSGLFQANYIFFSETETHLKRMGELFKESIEQSKVEILSDDLLIEEASNTNNLVRILSIIGIILAIILSIFITRGITIPLRKGLNFARKISEGNLTSQVECDTKDEIGLLCEALTSMAVKLKSIVTEIQNSTVQINTASKEVSISSQKISQGASEQASATEEVLASMEEMVANITQNTSNSNLTQEIAENANHNIKESNDSTITAVESMKKIADKIQVINDIAFQTNILALNAAVEAARAGEEGKGFAIVAVEVRKLAERSKVAAEEINELSTKGVIIAENAGKQLQSIVPEIEKTAKLVSEITSSSKEQTSGSEQINNGMNSINQMTQQYAASSEEMAASSEELSNQAEQLKELISFFKV